MNNVRLCKLRTTCKDRQRLVGKHCGQFLANPPGPELLGITAVTFEPASQTPSMLEQTVRPLGATIMIVAQYQQHPSIPNRLCLPICGMYATAAADGSVSYGGKGNYVFARDAALRSRPSRNGRAIDYLHETNLLETSMRIDATCRWLVSRRCRLPSVPLLPRILLGFASSESPLFEDSAPLRRLAAKQLGVAVTRLGACGTVLLDRLLRDIWHSRLILPDDPQNRTGLVLVDAELCTNARRSLVIFEDFRELRGDRGWNPARTMTFSTIDNPAGAILRRNRIESDRGFDQVTGDQLEQLELEMRRALGAGFGCVEQGFIFDALTNTERQVVDLPLAIQLLRHRLLPNLARSCTDADLVHAVTHPDHPLPISGRCRLQCMALHDDRGFTSDELNRRVTIRISSSRVSRAPAQV